MKFFIKLIVISTLVILPVRYFYNNGINIVYSNFLNSDKEVKNKSELLMKAMAKDIIAKAHPLTTYKSYQFKQIETTEKEYLAVYEITYTDIIEGELYLVINLVFSKENLDFITIRRKSDSSKFPIIDLDFSSIKEIVKSLSLLK